MTHLPEPWYPFLPLDEGDDLILGAAASEPIPADLTVVAGPRISRALFHEVLTLAGSPAAAENAGDALYAICLEYGLDPAVALAFFQHESRYGREGVAVTTKGWGNMRIAEDNAYPRKRFTRPNGDDIGYFAVYPSYAVSLRDWCRYILRRYVRQGHTTVAGIIPIYAPSSDKNKPASYIRAVIRAVTAWQRISLPEPTSDPWAAWGTRYPVPMEQRHYAIPQRWLKEGTLGAAMSAEQYDDRGARSMQWFERGLVVWLGGDRTEVVR